MSSSTPRLGRTVILSVERARFKGREGEHTLVGAEGDTVDVKLGARMSVVISALVDDGVGAGGGVAAGPAGWVAATFASACAWSIHMPA